MDDPVVVAGHRMRLQSESVRGEGRWHYVECMDCRGSAFCPVLHGSDHELAFVGSRARAKAERALEALRKEME